MRGRRSEDASHLPIYRMLPIFQGVWNCLLIITTIIILRLEMELVLLYDSETLLLPRTSGMAAAAWVLGYYHAATGGNAIIGQKWIVSYDNALTFCALLAFSHSFMRRMHIRGV